MRTCLFGRLRLPRETFKTVYRAPTLSDSTIVNYYLHSINNSTNQADTVFGQCCVAASPTVAVRPFFEMSTQNQREILQVLYERLYRSIGPLHWWPANSPFEVMIGAILTQNTAWTNVEKAIKVLKEKNLLHPRRLYSVREKTLAEAIRSSGFFNLKAKRIRSFLRFLFSHYRGDIARMFSEETGVLREQLLQIKGLGPETVDSILLYAGEKPVFVVDAYTKRILLRHGLIFESSGYEEIQNLFMENLESDVRLFNEYHALLVHVGKNFCRPVQNCGPCPLKGLKRKTRAARQ